MCTRRVFYKGQEKPSSKEMQVLREVKLDGPMEYGWDLDSIC